MNVGRVQFCGWWYVRLAYAIRVHRDLRVFGGALMAEIGFAGSVIVGNVVFFGFDFMCGCGGKGENAFSVTSVMVGCGAATRVSGAVVAMVDDDAWAKWSVVEGRGVLVSVVAGGGHEGGGTRKEKGFCLENMMLTYVAIVVTGMMS
ncbi:hypothetical protein V8G54_006079 [Vigna mungo]|uniref:Uncharacterized protein n=1 Tax=Vigna mungo TaxID=3915 RepID=A0AAQ3P1J6_VIGMU